MKHLILFINSSQTSSKQSKCGSLCSPLDTPQYFTLLPLLSELSKVIFICSFYSCMRHETLLYILTILLSFHIEITNKHLKNHKYAHNLTVYYFTMDGFILLYIEFISISNQMKTKYECKEKF